mmetsp:Transcript_16435/g.28474  ORF Transcript_16435/g.28474 Transcript_16435/m.28474 type:complete len:290 (+) Transcript_16435:814-1683(+)
MGRSRGSMADEAEVEEDRTRQIEDHLSKATGVATAAGEEAVVAAHVSGDRRQTRTRTGQLEPQPLRQLLWKSSTSSLRMPALAKTRSSLRSRTRRSSSPSQLSRRPTTRLPRSSTASLAKRWSALRSRSADEGGRLRRRNASSTWRHSASFPSTAAVADIVVATADAEATVVVVVVVATTTVATMTVAIVTRVAAGTMKAAGTRTKGSGTTTMTTGLAAGAATDKARGARWRHLEEQMCRRNLPRFSTLLPCKLKGENRRFAIQQRTLSSGHSFPIHSRHTTVVPKNSR